VLTGHDHSSRDGTTSQTAGSSCMEMSTIKLTYPEWEGARSENFRLWRCSSVRQHSVLTLKFLL